MTSKKHPIEIMEEALECEKNNLESCQLIIKSSKTQVTNNEGYALVCIARISGLEDALHKLKGLDNLEKKNKIADPAGFVAIDVEGFDSRKLVKHVILPEIISLLKDRQFSFREQMSELLK